MAIVSATLEQLDQYGSLDSLSFSLDNAQYVDYKNPNLDHKNCHTKPPKTL